MRAAWFSLLAIGAACGRYRFDDRATPPADAAAPDACVVGGACTYPSAVCWSGVADCAGTCAMGQPLDQVACPGGTCADGICAGDVSPAFMYGPAGTNAYFGTSLDSDGQRLIVGAVVTNAAYIVENVGGTWTVTHTLTSTWGPASSDFGAAVAIQGDLAVVGSRYSKGPGMAPASGTGGVIVIYQRDANDNWNEIAQVAGPDGGEFGNSIDLDNGRILVGAEYADTVAGGYGTAYIVEGSGSSWAPVATLNDVGADRLGHFVQLRGDRAFTGSLWDPGPNSSETGAIRVWERQGNGSWALSQTLQPDDMRVDAFGQGFSVDGDRLAAGVPWFYEPTRGEGAIYLYTRDPMTGQWETPGPMLSPPDLVQKDGNLGRGIMLRGDHLYATQLDWLGSASGAAYTLVYRLQPDGSWLEVGRRFDAGGGANGFAYGGIECDLQMTLVGDEAVVGYPVRGYSGGKAPGAIVFQDTAGL